MSSLITQNSLAAIPGILTSSLSNLGSVVTSLSALQSVNPAMFQNFSGQIQSLMQGFDAAANITNAIGGLAQSAQLLGSTPFSPSNILGFAQNLTNVASQLDYLASGAYGSGFMPVSSFRPSVQEASQASKDATNSFLYYPSNLGKYWFAMKFVQFDWKTKMFAGTGYSPITTLDRGAIMLPLPSSINDINLVQYSEFNPGTEVATAAFGLISGVLKAAAIARMGGRAAAATAEAATAAPQAASSLAGIGSTLAGSLGSAVSTAAKVGSLQAGIAINPLSTLLLQGPALKQHTFTWRLSPESAADSAKLNAIIANMKYHMSPSLLSGSGGFVLTYPSMVRCLFYNHDKLYEFKDAVVTGLSINFSPTTPSFFKSADGKGGYPTEVEIQVSIKELEAWLREDFAASGPRPTFYNGSGPAGPGPGRFGGVM
jgi:hypothetical protein